jgi:hypothetical protein
LKHLAALLLLLWASVASAADITNPQSVAGTQRVLGTLRGANFNVTTDQAIPMAVAVYQITSIIVTNCSASLTTAAGGFYPTTAKGGTPLVAAAQIYTALTAASIILNPTLNAAANFATTRLTTPINYLSLTLAQGAGATCDVYVLGQDLT